MQQYIVRVSVLYWNDSQSICKRQCSTQIQNATLRSSCDLFSEHCGGYINNKTGSHIRYDHLFMTEIWLETFGPKLVPCKQIFSCNRCYGHHGGYLWVALWNCNYCIWLEMLAILFRSIYISCRAHKVTMIDLQLKNVEKHGLQRFAESLCRGLPSPYNPSQSSCQ